MRNWVERTLGARMADDFSGNYVERGPAFTALFAVVTAIYIALLLAQVLFFRRRHLQPIRGRFPFQSHFLATILIIGGFLSALLTHGLDHFSCAVYRFSFNFVYFSSACIVVRILHLYCATEFNRLHVLLSEPSCDVSAVLYEWKKRPLIRYGKLIQSSSIQGLALSVIALCLLLSWEFKLFTGEYAEESNPFCENDEITSYVVLSIFTASMVLFGLLTYRYPIRDNLYIQLEIRMMVAIPFAASALYVVLNLVLVGSAELWVSNLVWIFTPIILVGVLIIFPLVVSYEWERQEGGRPSHCVSCKKMPLDGDSDNVYQPQHPALVMLFTIHDPDGLSKFKEFCASENSVGNVLFYERLRSLDRELLKLQSGPVPSPFADQLREFYNKFLGPRASFQVKLPTEVLDKFHRFGSRNGSPQTVVDRDKARIILSHGYNAVKDLMLKAFIRFNKHKLYQEFLDIYAKRKRQQGSKSALAPEEAFSSFATTTQVNMT